MAQAGESDGKVIQRLRDNEAAFAALTPDAAAGQLPRLQVRFGRTSSCDVWAQLQGMVLTECCNNTSCKLLAATMFSETMMHSISPHFHVQPSLPVACMQHAAHLLTKWRATT